MLWPDDYLNKVLQGDCLEVMPTIPENSIDAIVCDPPYGLSFMGKDWDHGVPGVHFWVEALRVAKPGSHLLAFGGTRTFHRLAVAIEDAGWEIRDTLGWLYGSGFPKSHNIGKAVDKLQGNDRIVVGVDKQGKKSSGVMAGHHGWAEGEVDITRGTSVWEGFGTALKPAWEPIIMARKPFTGTVAANVLKWGTGAINIDGCRIDGVPPSVPQPMLNSPTGKIYGFKTGEGRNGEMSQASGRWPANIIHDGSEEVMAVFPESGNSSRARRGQYGGGIFAGGLKSDKTEHSDSGSAARFFYCAKASKADRDGGLNPYDKQMRNDGRETEIDNPYQRGKILKNFHPTVKPTTLMQYLCRLVTPPGGIILDPFMGSGSTGKAAKLEGFHFIGIELSEDYCKIAENRIAATHPNKQLEFK
jgi:DNA modification methylase